MKHNSIDLQSLLEHSFVISVNQKQLQTFNERFKAAKLDCPLPKLFRGFQLKNGIHRQSGFIKTNNVINCTLSHMAIVTAAAALGWPYVCIFEEDALPASDAKEQLEQILKVVPDNCKCLRLGYRIVDDKNIARSSRFISNVTAWGSQAQIVFSSYYDEMLKNLEYLPVADITALNNKNVLLADPCLFVQKHISPETSIHNGKPNRRYAIAYRNDSRFDFENG